jgi:hypothetical protein
MQRVAQSALTFTKFGINYLQMLKELGMEKKNAKAFMYGMISPLLVGGLRAAPGASAAIAVAQFLAKYIFGDDRDQEKRLYDKVRAVAGSAGEKALRYGASGALAGVNISGSLEPNLGFLAPSRASDLFGAGGGVYQDAMSAWERYTAGDNWGAAVKILPSGLGGPVKALRESDGVKTGRGRPVYDDQGHPLTLSTIDLLKEAAGFSPVNRALLMERHHEGKRETANFAARKKNLYERYRWAVETGAQDRQEKLRAEIMDYNQSAREAHEAPITHEGITRALMDMRRPSRSRINELR